MRKSLGGLGSIFLVLGFASGTDIARAQSSQVARATTTHDGAVSVEANPDHNSEPNTSLTVTRGAQGLEVKDPEATDKDAIELDHSLSAQSRRGRKQITPAQGEAVSTWSRAWHERSLAPTSPFRLKTSVFAYRMLDEGAATYGGALVELGYQLRRGIAANAFVGSADFGERGIFAGAELSWRLLALPERDREWSFSLLTGLSTLAWKSMGPLYAGAAIEFRWTQQWSVEATLRSDGDAMLSDAGVSYRF